MSVRETYYSTHRGINVYQRTLGLTIRYVAYYAGDEYVASEPDTVYAWIDRRLGPEEEAPEEGPLEVYVEDYRGCSIYASTETGLYHTLCVPGFSGSLSEVKDRIDAYQEAQVEELKEEEVTEEEEEPIIPVVIVEAPALPFYAAWLKPIVEYLGALTENVMNYATLKLAPLKDGVLALVTLPADIITALNEGIPALFQKTRNKGADIATETLKEVVHGTEPWMSEIEAALGEVQSGAFDVLNKAVADGTAAAGDGDPGASVEALEAMKARILQVAIANFTLHAIVESGSLGQMEFMKDLDPMVISKFGLDQIVSRATLLPIEKAVLTPAEQAYNRAYPNMIPAASNLIEMVVKEVIPLDRFKAEMLKLGFKESWSQAIWDAHFIPPDYTQIREALYRGVVTAEQYQALKRLVDLDPRFDTIWDGLLEQVPPLSELVNQRVKEVLDQGTFTRYVGYYGLSPEWAERIWAAHFIPPTLGDLLTAWRRGVIDTARLDELMVIVDLDPRFKDVFDTRRYVDPSVTQARFMFETGAIDETRVHEIVLRNGYNEQDAADITHWIIGFQERRFRTSYLQALATGATYDAYTEEEVEEAVTEAGYTPEVSEWLIKGAAAREATRAARLKAPSPKLLSLGDLKKAYMQDLLTEDEYRRDLLMKGYETGEVDLLVQLLNAEKVTTIAGGKKVALSQAELLNAWRYEQVSEDHVRIELSLRGLSEDEINILIETKKRQWGMI
uniref:Uncharacterized protein n=1 Tax=viral metagenome TaxID=1070528 RepID=A0A6M3X550_9ZZZZ